EMSDAESEDAEIGADAPSASPLPEFIEVIQSHKRVASNDEDGNQHEWSLRLREGAQQIVQEVLWRLHPTFRKPDVK
ncbi:TAF14, partial [Symbiodinium necroappetens]